MVNVIPFLDGINHPTITIINVKMEVLTILNEIGPVVFSNPESGTD